MKEEINICKKNENGSLTVVEIKKMTVKLNESKMALEVVYLKKIYEVLGKFNLQYIVVE